MDIVDLILETNLKKKKVWRGEGLRKRQREKRQTRKKQRKTRPCPCMSRILVREGYKKFGLRRGLSERPTNLIKWRWQRAK